MTDFIKFTFGYPNKIKYYGLDLKFYCSEIDTPLCSICPNGTKSGTCNHFTKQETAYLIAHHPELFI